MAQAIPGASSGLGAGLRGNPKRHRKEKRIKGLFQFAAGISVVISVLIVVSLSGEAFAFLRDVDLGSLFSEGWFPRRGTFDVRTLITGTLLVSLIAMIVATPIGLGAAIYLSEYARPRVRRIVKPVLEILAGIPSVVLGFFALTWISPNLISKICTDSSAFNLAAAGVAVGVLVTPLVASIAEDAMSAVPMSLREGSYGLGARKRTVMMQIVFPAAVSGIAAALIVGVSRAIGETMVVAIASGATGGSLFTLNSCGPGQTMTAAMAALATGSDQVRGDAAAIKSLFFIGFLLFLMTLTLNVLSERFVRRARKRY